MTEPRNKPRPSGYRPPTPNQFRQPTVDDCTWYASAYAWAKASNGKLVANPIAVRRTVDPDLQGATRLSDATDAFDAYFDENWRVEHRQSPFVPYSYWDVIAMLREGCTFVVAGDYEDLPPHYRRWTFNDIFDHAMAFHEFRPDIRFGKDSIGSTWLYDPLGGGPNNLPYSGEWIPVEPLLHDFAWTTNGALSVLAINANTGDEMLNLQLPDVLPKRVNLKANARLLRTPKSTAPIIRKVTDGGEALQFIGRVRGDADWLVVKDGSTAVYTHESNGVIVPNPDYTVTPVDPNPALVETIDSLTQRATTIASSLEATARTLRGE